MESSPPFAHLTPYQGFSQETLEKYARVLYWGLTRAHGREPRKSSPVRVSYDRLGLPLAEAVVKYLHARNLQVIVRASETADMQLAKLSFANNKRLALLAPGEEELAKALVGDIRIIAPESLNHLALVDPEQVSRLAKAQAPLRKILKAREAAGEYAWTLGYFPTEALASASGLTLDEYAGVVRKACLLHDGTPVRAWKRFAKTADTLAGWLTELNAVGYRVQGPGVDLLIRRGERRRWICLTGRNLPSFECYTSPDWRGVEGHFTASLPSHRSGFTVRDVKLTIRAGRVVELTAAEGRELALTALSQDQGAASIGEFALVDKRFSPIDRYMATTLFDENHGGEHGSCHIALGDAYANAFDGDQTLLTEGVRRDLGFNSSGLHWDLVHNRGVVVSALLPQGGREIIYQDGQFRCPTLA